jgi:hypothetical protein
MKFVLVNDHAPRGSSACTSCLMPIGTSYLRDLSSRLPYCDHQCYLCRPLVPMVLLAGAGIDCLLAMELQWARFQRAFLDALKCS